MYIHCVLVLCTGAVQSLLGHSHAWVQLASCQLLGLVFAECDQDEVAHSLITAATAEQWGGASRSKRRRLERHCLVDMSTVSGTASIVTSGTASIVTSGTASIVTSGTASIVTSGTASIVTSGTASIVTSGTASIVTSGTASIVTSGTASIVTSGTASIVTSGTASIVTSVSNCCCCSGEATGKGFPDYSKSSSSPY